MTPIIKRLELAEAALVKNGFQCVDDVWAPAPVTPAASVDTAEFRELLGEYFLCDEDTEALPNESRIIAHIDAHTARAVAAALVRVQGVADANHELLARVKGLRQELGTAQIEAANNALCRDEQTARAEKAEAALAAAPQQHAQAALSDEPLRLAIALGEARGTLRAIYTVSKEPFVTQKAVDAAEKINRVLASHQPAAAQAPTGGDLSLSGWLRHFAGDSGYSHNDYADTMRQAAEQLERMTAAQQGGELPQDERAAFEGWAAKKLPHDAMRASDGTYYASTMDFAWSVWKAALAQRAASVPAQAWSPTAEQFKDWCERHDMRADRGDHREMFDDAATLYLTAPVPAASVPDAGLSPAATDILAERRRQIEKEGYDAAHDDEHANDEIAAYATFYAMPPAARDWPADDTGYGATWGEAIIPEQWGPAKPGDRRGELVKAGALIIAEIERFDRAAAPQTTEKP